MDISTKNADRFTGFADTYDLARPKMPLCPVEIITRYLGKKPGLVIDMGCGTGLSTVIWKDRCEQVIGVEPNDDMRAIAEQKAGDNLSFIKAFAHETGLASACAEAVICSQSFHWMNPDLTLKEINRILKNDGIFATVDCDWPPVCNWEAEKAYLELFKAVAVIEEENIDLKDSFTRWDKKKHLQNIRDSGYFRYTRELVFSNTEVFDADRFIGIAISQGSLQGVLKKSPNLIEQDLKAFIETIRRLFGGRNLKTDFGYRMRIGIK
ncbi:MAG TPA: class I SAM-dependent methyltransferase [Oscillospiraceae bacterium]|nr:class I SAM-dependent methyltransferase [Oscillospiraceae bacterium]HPF55180.1 class I SAM-dependent methyltransferase [Clostridiales bacterium]HPK36506.1 class I SAM-dependent methyltransferase [Oscillospiraceae bacterium]HPR75739.1 class I SAM-dependent methyltransferase [Oscillospiraceae bacterium]